MILIAPRATRQAESRRFLQTDLVGGNFNVPSLVSHANKVTNPSAGDYRPLLFFGKRIWCWNLLALSSYA